MPTSSRPDTRFTYDDFVKIPDDGLRHEIIDGVHYVTPSPVLSHQVLLGRLHIAVGLYLDARPEVGQVFLSPLDTVFTPWDVVEPDLMFVAGDQLHILTEPNIQGAPALVVEILSPSTRRRDLGIKHQLFERGGVREYWVVDPKARELLVFRRTDEGRLAKVHTLTAADAETLTTPLLPDFSLPLSKLFAER